MRIAVKFSNEVKGFQLLISLFRPFQLITMGFGCIHMTGIGNAVKMPTASSEQTDPHISNLRLQSFTTILLCKMAVISYFLEFFSNYFLLENNLFIRSLKKIYKPINIFQLAITNN